MPTRDSSKHYLAEFHVIEVRLPFFGLDLHVIQSGFLVLPASPQHLFRDLVMINGRLIAEVPAAGMQHCPHLARLVI